MDSLSWAAAPTRTLLEQPLTGSGPSAVVVAYGAADLLAECLAALGGVRDVVVIDNSSDPEIASLAARQGCRYVDPGRNLGFAAGVNLALRHVDPDHDVLLVNPDALVPAPVTERLTAALHRDERIAAVAPALAGPDGRPQRASWPFPTPAGVWLDSLGLSRLRRTPHFLVGAVLLLSRAALEEVGPFDERFFLYAEETDWQLRAHRAGWRLVVAPDITAVHVGAGTSTNTWRRDVLFHRSAVAFGKKWYGRSGWAVMWLGSVVGAALRAVLHRDERGAEARRLLRLFILGSPPRGVEPA